jgi:hypothetical protein
MRGTPKNARHFLETRLASYKTRNVLGTFCDERALYAAIWNIRSGEAATSTRHMLIDVYQERASECLRRAADTPDMEDRRALRELALCWLRLSDRVEEFRHHAEDAPFRAA